MSTVAVVWLVVGLLSAVVTLAMLIALIRHVRVLGRAVGRFGAEVSPIAQAIAAAGERPRARRPVPARSTGGSPGDPAVR